MRDVKRFANSFKISFELLKDEVDLLDLALLELLKVGFFEIYEMLSKREFIEIGNNSPRTYVLDQSKWSAFIEGKSWGNNQKEDL